MLALTITANENTFYGPAGKPLTVLVTVEQLLQVVEVYEKFGRAAYRYRVGLPEPTPDNDGGRLDV